MVAQLKVALQNEVLVDTQQVFPERIYNIPDFDTLVDVAAVRILNLGIESHEVSAAL